MEVRVLRYCYNWANDKDNLTIDTTSRSLTWSRKLSPFLLGPVPLYGGWIAKNVENAWQYSKVYASFAQNGNPTQAYWDWARTGWNNQRAERYPMGKGARPLYSYWDGQKLDYVSARKKIYAPLYSLAVEKTDAFSKLKELKEKNHGTIWLMDFDAYDHKKEGLTYEQVINNPYRKMGHAFVLAMMLDDERVWEKSP